MIKVDRCNNCGGNAFTNPSKVAMPAVNEVNAVDMSRFLFVNVIVCHNCKNVMMFEAEK